ncbi:MAG TPA: phenylalanine--tRNA ligase subunit beta [Thermoanaerobaculia bacterium]|nr:phenylalanine--tRNA ligase subunit beta [Thermoanaerobaculia bacterium]
MKFLLEHLRTFTDLPERPHAARELLDDVGIEVKSSEATDVGTVFNCELLANRGDHYCYEGVAREARGRTGGELRYPPVKALKAQPAPPDRVRIETPLCLVFTMTELSGKGGSLPANVLAPLTAADIHSISAPVDASNLTNFDLGQPSHAYDAEKVDGPIIVRLSRKGEKAWLLFTPEPIEIPEGIMVIADNSKILGIAGVIGCADSGISSSTTRILLEAACFDPVAVRISSRMLNLATDAAARFMRGGDPTLPLVGAGRVAKLLEEHCGYRVGDAFITGDWKNPRRTIEVDVERTKRFIGANLSHFEMAERLTRYGFTVEPEVNKLTVTVPPRRLWDVHFEADLQEELLKSVGYNETDVSLPRVEMGALPSHRDNVLAKTSELLVAEGFYEIFTDSFYSPKMRERLGVAEGDPLWEHVDVLNSQEGDYAMMRNNTVAQALDALATNVNNKLAGIKIYEWARVYLPDMSEREILWALANGRDRGPFWGDKGRAADAVYLKGILEQLRLELRIDLDFGPADDHRLARFFHPGRRSGIRVDGKLAGIFGELHPTVVQSFGIKRQRPVYFEIEAQALLAPPSPRTYSEPPSRQPIVRNVAYAIPSGITADDVRNALLEAAPQFLRAIRIIDLFEMPDARAVTFEIEYLSEEALTGETINAATEAMMASVATRFGGRVVLRA